MSRIKVFLSRRNRILFYNSYILPYLEFCCIIWGNCSSTLEDKLVKFQKRAARVILDCDFYTPSSELTYKKAMLMYRIINNICPDYLKKLCLIYLLHIMSTWSTNYNQLYMPKPNCELFRKSFMYSGSAIWNSLPLHVKNATSVNTFKCLYLKLKRLNDHY